MKYDLTSISSIGEDNLRKLQQAGIQETDDLLIRTGSPQQRSSLSHYLGLPEDDLLRWAGIADLVRVKGIGLSLAQLLIATSLVQSTQSLATSDASAVHRAVIESNRGSSFLKRDPTKHEIVECIEGARQLKPVLFLHGMTLDEFRTQMDARKREEAVTSRRMDFFVLFGVLIVFILIMTITLYEIHASMKVELLKVGAPFTGIWAIADKGLFSVGITILVITTAWLVLLIATGWGLYISFVHLVSNKLLFLIFNRPISRHAYIELSHYGFPKAARNTWIALIIIIAGGAWMAYLIAAPGVSASPSRLNLLPLYLTCALAVPIASYPELERVLHRRNAGTGLIPSVLQQYLVYRLMQIVAAIAAVILFVHFLVPVSLHLLQGAVDRWVNPSYLMTVDRARDALLNLDLQDRGQLSMQYEYLARLDKLRNPLQIEGVLNEYGGLQLVLATISWWSWFSLALVILMFFILPFFLLGKTGRAILFIVITACSYALGRILENAAPTLLFLPANSVFVAMLVCFFVLANTLLFDWFYKIAEEMGSSCACCQSELPRGSSFCWRCGAKQQSAETSRNNM